MVLAVVGIFIAGFLTMTHYMNIVPPCTNNGCEKVLTHPSSMWLGIPVSLFGLGAYVTLLGLATLRGMLGIAKTRPLIVAGFAISAIGMTTSLVLTYYAIAFIGATCVWCLSNFATMILSFIAHTMLAQADPVPDTGSPKELKLAASIAALALLGLAGSAYGLRNASPLNSTKYLKEPFEKFVPEGTHLYGSVEAPVTIVEFGDLLCPSCKAHFPDMMKMVEQSGGRLSFAFRHFPMWQLPSHKMSFKAAVLAECAAESGKFWPYLNAVYQLPDDSVTSLDPLLDVARGLQLPADKLAERAGDSNDPAFNRVYNDLAFGDRLGLHATPTFFIVAKGVKPKVSNFNGLSELLKQEPYHSLIMTGHAPTK